jgi:hypothetical protein
MLIITLFCVMCAVAANFPELVLGLAALVAFNVPAACVFFVLSRFYDDSAGLFFRVFVGAIFGWLAVPGVMAVGGWEAWLVNFMIGAGPPALGALLLATPAVVIHQTSQLLKNQKSASDPLHPQPLE